MPIETAAPSPQEDSTRTWLASLPGWARVVMAVVPLWVAVAGAQSVRAPTALEARDSGSRFSTEKAMETVAQVSRAPHPVGTPEHQRVQQFIVSRLTELGLDVTQQPATSCTQLAGQVRCAHVNNLLGRLRGTGNGDTMVLCAHPDAAVHSMGASDDGSGVATVLEVARVLASGPALRNDVLFLFADGEEEGLLGASAFLRTPEMQRVQLVINVDARGAWGPSMMFETSQGNHALVSALGATSVRPISNSLMYSAARVLPNGTDALVFEAAGIPTFSFAFVGGVQHYHHLTDTAEHLDPQSVFHHGAQALALLQHLGNANLERLKSTQDSIYFDVLGKTLVEYPDAGGQALALLSAFLFFSLLVRARRREGTPWRKFMIAFGTLLIATVASITAVVAFHVVVNGALAGHSPLGQATALHAGYILLAMLASLAVYRRAARTQTLRHLQLGAMGGLCAVSLVTAALLPGASYVFQWALFFSTASVLASTRVQGLARAVVECAVPLPGLLLVAQGLGLGMDIQQATAPEVIVLPLAWTVAVLLPVAWIFSSGRWFRTLSIACVACLGTGVLQSHLDLETPRTNTITYGLDAATQVARWSTRDKTPDAWVDRFLKDDPQFNPLPWLTPNPTAMHHARALVLPLAAPTLSVVAEHVDHGLRVVTIRAQSRRAARSMLVWGGANVPVEGLFVDGRLAQHLSGYPTELERWWWSLLVGPLPDASFVLHYSAVPEDGFEFTISFSPQQHPTLHLVDESDGLPPSDATVPRPPPWVPGDPSDITQVGTVLTL